LILDISGGSEDDIVDQAAPVVEAVLIFGLAVAEDARCCVCVKGLGVADLVCEGFDLGTGLGLVMLGGRLEASCS
jgi:hypothetical protein